MKRHGLAYTIMRARRRMALWHLRARRTQLSHLQGQMNAQLAQLTSELAAVDWQLGDVSRRLAAAELTMSHGQITQALMAERAR